MWTVLTSFLSFLSGLWAATFLQDRQERRRQLGVVRALRAELQRIQSEGRFTSPAFIDAQVAGMRSLVPQLAPWVEQLTVDVASTDAHLLAGFMNLDRILNNLSGASQVLAQAQDQARAMALQLSNVTLSDPSAVESVHHAQQGMKNAEAALVDARFVADTDFGLAKAELSRLLTKLDSLEGRLSAGFFTHLSWK